MGAARSTTSSGVRAFACPAQVALSRGSRLPHTSAANEQPPAPSCPPWRIRASLASCSAAATAKPFGARTEARSGASLPSSCATSAGRPVSSLSLPAIKPISPTDHGPRTATRPSPRKARASSRSDPGTSPRSARASSIATFVNSFRSRLIPSSNAASSAASAGSSVVSSARAGAASPMPLRQPHEGARRSRQASCQRHSSPSTRSAQ